MGRAEELWNRNGVPPGVDRYTLVKTVPSPSLDVGGNNQCCSWSVDSSSPAYEAAHHHYITVHCLKNTQCVWTRLNPHLGKPHFIVEKLKIFILHWILHWWIHDLVRGMQEFFCSYEKGSRTSLLLKSYAFYIPYNYDSRILGCLSTTKKSFIDYGFRCKYTDSCFYHFEICQFMILPGPFWVFLRKKRPQKSEFYW